MSTGKISTAKNWFGDHLKNLAIVGAFFFILVVGFPSIYPFVVNNIFIPLGNGMKQVPVLADIVLWFETTRATEGPVFVSAFIAVIFGYGLRWWQTRETTPKVISTAKETVKSATEKVTEPVKQVAEKVTDTKDDAIAKLEAEIAALKASKEPSESEG